MHQHRRPGQELPEQGARSRRGGREDEGAEEALEPASGGAVDGERGGSGGGGGKKAEGGEGKGFCGGAWWGGGGGGGSEVEAEALEAVAEDRVRHGGVDGGAALCNGCVGMGMGVDA